MTESLSSLYEHAEEEGGVTSGLGVLVALWCGGMSWWLLIRLCEEEVTLFYQQFKPSNIGQSSE